MEPFLGQILIFGFNFNPRGWAFCNGQLLNISQNTALFSLLGTLYGGDGVNTFALPDLRGRSAIHFGQGAGLSNFVIGQRGGAETHTLTLLQLPAHNHGFQLGGAVGTTAEGDGNYVSFNTSADTIFTSAAHTNSLNPGAIANTGSGQSFGLRDPYLALNFCIALQGIFPSRN